MNGLFFPSNLKLINLTPYKLALCNLIVIFMKNEKLNIYTRLNEINNINFFNGLKYMIDQYQCEISKKIFYAFLKEMITYIVLNNCCLKTNKTSLNSNSNSVKIISELTEIIITQLESFFNKTKSINDVYCFFNIEIHDLKIRNDEGQILLETGGLIDNYIRKCLFAFYKLSFEDISKLFLNLQLYINGEDIHVQLTNRESEILFEKQMKELDAGCKRKIKDVYLAYNINEKILKNFNYKHKYFFYAKHEIDITSIEKMHKFFDYNMKYFYNDANQNETRIHYLLLNMVQYYFDNFLYDQAIQILFECIKLSQSNCDHEGLLKCFIWMHKIYRNLGKFEIASKCLATCLIKSFQNNFQLLYLISVSELAYLNYTFHSNIGGGTGNTSYTGSTNTTTPTIEEKILSASNSYVHAYKNILQFLSLSKTDYVYESSPIYYFKYVHLNLIYNCLRKGNISLAIGFVKRLIEFLELDRAMGLGNFKTNHIITKETIEVVLNLLLEVAEFDFEFAIEKIYSIGNTWKIETSYLNRLVQKLKIKILSYSGKYQNTFQLENHNENYCSNSKDSLYNSVVTRYYNYYSIVTQYPDTMISLEIELLKFQKFCKDNKFQKFKILTGILITKIFLRKELFTESLYNIKKMIKKYYSSSGNKYTFDLCMLKLKICLAEIYSKMKDATNVQIVLSEIENSIESIGDVVDKFTFYSLVIQIKLINKISIAINHNLLACIKYSILSNNNELIKQARILFELAKSAEPEVSITVVKFLKKHEENTINLFNISNKFILPALGELELFTIIFRNNRKLINTITIYMNEFF